MENSSRPDEEVRPHSLEVVTDLSDARSCSDGFLQVRRLEVRHQYSNGEYSPIYPCDVVSRRGTDAVGVVLWFRDECGVPMVVLKEGVRPPIWLRRQKDLIQPDPHAPLMLIELVAGILEDTDRGLQGLSQRAAAETREEAGIDLAPTAFSELGAAMFPSPGVADEKVFLMCAELSEPPPISGSETGGDGSPMEHGTRVLVMPLKGALADCTSGVIPTMLAELGLRRLAEKLAKEND